MRTFNVSEFPLEGVNLIEAGAGTGKTYTIEAIYIRLLLETNLSAENILAVTYTEAATSSLRERIGDRIRKAAQAFADGSTDDEFLQKLLKKYQDRDPARILKTLKKALADFQNAAIFTIHGFCRKTLLDYAFESRSRFDSELIENQEALIEEIGADFWRKRLYSYPRKLVEFLLRKNDHPEKLSRKTSAVLSKPRQHILTGLESADVEKWFQKADALYSKLAGVWKNSSSEIESVLLKHPGLKHNVYNKKNTPRWIKRMDVYLSGGDLFKFEPDILRRFGDDAVMSCRNNKCDPPRHEIFELCRRLRQTLEKIELSFKKDYFDFVFENLDARKQSLNVRYFDDLLKNLSEALLGSQGNRLTRQIRRKYQAALIDEFQDTDPLQYEIFKTIFADKECRLYFIGDPKQSIYNFRGADIFAYLKAQEIADKKYTLNINWRSDRDLTKAVNYIFQFHDNPFIFEKISYPEVSGAEENPERSLFINNQSQVPAQIWHVDDNGRRLGKTKARKEVAEYLAGEITFLLNAGAKKEAFLLKKTAGAGVDADREYIAPEHIAVLVRSHHEAELTQRTLKKYSVPGVINAKESIHKSREFEEVEIIMSALAAPQSDSALKSALATDIWGFSARQIHELGKDDKKWEALKEKVRRYRLLWREEGFYPMTRRFIRLEKIAAGLLLFPDGERRLTNLLQIIEIIHEAESSDKLGMSALIKHAAATRLESSSSEESRIRLETDEKAIQILTIHAAKGLEYPIVFCPFAWGDAKVGEDEVFFHDDSNNHEPVLDLGSDKLEENKKKAEKEILAENIRLLYVALTRAKHRCYLVWGDINQTKKSALNYILHQGKDKNSEEQWSDLEKLVSSSQGVVALSAPDRRPEQYNPGVEKPAEPSRLKFKGKTEVGATFASYSSLSSFKADPDEADRDQSDSEPVSLEEPPLNQTVLDELDILNFPGGATTGNCFHEILEEIDFQSKDDSRSKAVVKDKLSKYNLDLKWEETAFRAVSNILSFPLLQSVGVADNFSLSQLDGQNRVSEMEFHFPIAAISHKGLLEAIAARPESEASSRNLRDSVKTLSFNSVGGFLKGYIDLIFHHRGRYYIIDWKTNRVGEKPEDYDSRSLKEYMIKHSFVFQYHLYSVALHKTLKLRIPDYDFGEHFGGVFYIFVRGVDEQNNRGVYYDGMDGAEELIKSLEKYFSGERA